MAERHASADAASGAILRRTNMGIYIKGVEMPEFGEKIIILTSSGYVEDVSGQVISGVEAISVPPHGRLIDADRMLADNEKYFDQLGRPENEIQNRYNSVRASIRLAPTVIPAEVKHNE